MDSTVLKEHGRRAKTLLHADNAGFRFERKYRISLFDSIAFEERLKYVMKNDPNSDDSGHYTVRSLYFDSVFDTALKQKNDGLKTRGKFRIRLYDGETENIFLEKKQKFDTMTRKLSARITKAQCEDILAGNYHWLIEKEEPLFAELFHRINLSYAPKCIVEYDRRTFADEAGNVRVTLDKNIRGTPTVSDFLNKKIYCSAAPIGSYAVLEVKYDNFLPTHIRNMLQLGKLRQESVSKYVLARAYEI